MVCVETLVSVEDVPLHSTLFRFAPGERQTSSHAYGFRQMEPGFV